MTIWNNLVMLRINRKNLNFEWLLTSYGERKPILWLWIHFRFCFWSLFALLSFSISPGTLFLAPTVFLWLPSGGSALILKLQLHQLQPVSCLYLNTSTSWRLPENLWKEKICILGAVSERACSRKDSVCAPRRGCRLGRIAGWAAALRSSLTPSTINASVCLFKLSHPENTLLHNKGHF